MLFSRLYRLKDRDDDYDASSEPGRESLVARNMIISGFAIGGVLLIIALALQC
jgi:hypothetical protein